MKIVCSVLLLIALSWNTPAYSTIYEYTGKPFTTVYNNAYEGFNVAGYVEILSPVGGQTITGFGAWAFWVDSSLLSSDTLGIQTIPLSARLSPDTLSFDTWNFFVFLPHGLYIETTYDGKHLPSSTSSVDLVGSWYGPTVFASVGPDNPGTWTLRTSSVPEPSSYLLLGAGLGLIMFKRKWVASKK